MKIRRTPWWQYVVALLLGLIAGVWTLTDKLTALLEKKN